MQGHVPQQVLYEKDHSRRDFNKLFFLCQTRTFGPVTGGIKCLGGVSIPTYTRRLCALILSLQKAWFHINLNFLAKCFLIKRFLYDPTAQGSSAWILYPFTGNDGVSVMFEKSLSEEKKLTIN
jgi:hypothetical protein